jgi:hypothetical protein
MAFPSRMRLKSKRLWRDLSPVRRLPSLSQLRQAGASFEERTSPGGFIPTLRLVAGP